MEDDIMNDLRLPAGWQSFARAGWDVMSMIVTGERQEVVSKVTFSDGRQHPSNFSLLVTGKELKGDHRPFSVTLMFRLDQTTRDTSLDSAYSGDLDLDLAINALRQHRPMAWWSKKAVLQLAASEIDRQENFPYADGLNDGEWKISLERAYEQYMLASELSTSRRRNRITDGRLDEVASIYQEAESAGDSPTQAVSERLHTSHSHAAYLVSMARKKGKLPPYRR